MSKHENNIDPVNSVKHNQKKTALYIFLAIVIGLTTNIFMGLLMDGSKIWKSVSTVSIWVLIIPFSAYICVSLVDSIRLWIVSRASSYPIKLVDCILNSMVGGFFAHITPLAIGGQPFQIYHLHRHGMPVRVATNIIFSRFVVNAMLLVLVLLIGIPVIITISHSISGLAIVFWLGLSVTVVFALFFLCLLLQPRIISWLSSFIAPTWLGKIIGRLTKRHEWQTEFDLYTLSLRDEVRLLWSKGIGAMSIDIVLNILSLVLQGLCIWYPLYILVSQDFSFMEVLVTYIAVWQVVFYIPSPGASGGLEGMFTLIFATMSGKAEMTLVAIVIWRFSTYYLSLIPGIILSSIAFGQKGKKIEPQS